MLGGTSRLGQRLASRLEVIGVRVVLTTRTALDPAQISVDVRRQVWRDPNTWAREFKQRGLQKLGCVAIVDLVSDRELPEVDVLAVEVLVAAAAGATTAERSPTTIYVGSVADGRSGGRYATGKRLARHRAQELGVSFVVRLPPLLDAATESMRLPAERRLLWWFRNLAATVELPTMSYDDAALVLRDLIMAGRVEASRRMSGVIRRRTLGSILDIPASPRAPAHLERLAWRVLRAIGNRSSRDSLRRLASWCEIAFGAPSHYDTAEIRG